MNDEKYGDLEGGVRLVEEELREGSQIELAEVILSRSLLQLGIPAFNYSGQLESIPPSDYKEKAASASPIWPYALEILAFLLKPSTV